MPLSLALVLHAHQPVDNFDAVIEQSYRDAYLPFLEAAAARPWLKLNLHFTGPLLEWLSRSHPEYLRMLARLLADERLEMLGGGYYEPILVAIPAVDQQEQIARLNAALRDHFGVTPRGAWLAERVWEPELPAVFARAGVEYVLVDDSHLELAGLPSDDLHGYWLSEAQGEIVRVIPSNYFLRQALPFRPVPEGLDYLVSAAQRHPESLLTMGDDLEKFGSWPHTARHVYKDGWLAAFFDGLEQRQDQVRTVRLSDYIGTHPPRGLAYIPSASYPEMMRWAGSGSWRAFLTKYPESNLLHKTQQDLSRRLAAGRGRSKTASTARTHLLAAECNDVYWHGWFGGLYSPHLRQVAFAHLLQADAAIAKLSHPPATRRFDLLRDGGEAVEMRSPELRLLIAPADGGSLVELDALAAHANLINSIRRRPEPYHDELRRRIAANPGHLPGQVAAPTQELAHKLTYDACAPAGARLYQDLQPDTAAYAVTRLEDGRLELRSGATLKCFSLHAAILECAISGLRTVLKPSLEWIFNLLAPDAADRGILHGGRRFRLDWEGELEPGPLVLCDGWRRLHIELRAEGACGWRVTPRYSVSQSEQGFEALYQGTSLLASWPSGTDTLRGQVKIFPCSCHF